MEKERIPGGVIRPREDVYILNSAAVVGREEYKGPLTDYFDVRDGVDDSFGMDSWEMAEAEMQRLAVNGVFAGSAVSPKDTGFLLAGDLLNQCAGSNYGLSNFGIPYLGLYGACSTAAEGLLLGSLLTGTTGQISVAVTSSHNCSAERQFRFPMEYGGQRTPTSQWTVTGSGAFMLALWFVIKIDDRGSKVNEANEQMVEEEKKEAEKSLSSGNSAEEKNEPSNKGE